MPFIQKYPKTVFLIQLSEEEVMMKERIEIVVKFCLNTQVGDFYSSLWIKRPFYFSRSNLTGLKIYRRILKYLYHDNF